MNRRSHLPPFVATLLLGAFTQALLAAEPPAGLSLRGRGGPWLLLDDARGAAPAAAATGAPAVAGEPRTLAAGDLDRDGMPDLAVGLATPQGGRIVIYPGNLDHLFPNQPEAKARRAGGLGVDEPFLAAATVIELDRAPDFLAIGDFDADGAADLVALTLGTDRLEPRARRWQRPVRRLRSVHLGGTITAFAAGEIDQRDLLPDLAVALVDLAGAPRSSSSPVPRCPPTRFPNACPWPRRRTRCSSTRSTATRATISRRPPRTRSSFHFGLGEVPGALAERRGRRTGAARLPFSANALASGEFARGDAAYRRELALLDRRGDLRVLGSSAPPKVRSSIRSAAS